MQDSETEEFWKEKELEKNSKYLISTTANYIQNFKDEGNKIFGLLYLMENGLYFENFEKISWIQQLGGGKRKKFEKMELFIPLASIIDMKNMEGKKSRSQLKTTEKLMKILLSRFEGLIVSYNDDVGNQKDARFECFSDPLLLCEKYYHFLGLEK